MSHKHEILFRLGFPPKGVTQPEDAAKHIVFATRYEVDEKGKPKKYVMDNGEVREFNAATDKAVDSFLKPVDGWVRMYVEVKDSEDATPAVVPGAAHNTDRSAVVGQDRDAGPSEIEDDRL